MALQTLSILDVFEPDAPWSTGESADAARALYGPSVLRVLADLRSRGTSLTWAATDPELVVRHSSIRSASTESTRA